MSEPGGPQGATSKVAVVGLGAMGGSMAAHLVHCGCEVRGYDPNPAARAQATAAGVRVEAGLAETVAGVDAVITSLPNSPIVRSCWLGSPGVLDTVAAGTLVLEMSSIDPATMREVGEPARAAGIRVLDCPVSGGPAEAANGTLTLLVGGLAEDIVAAAPVLAYLGGEPLFTGDLGTGKVVKLVNNLMAMGNIAVAAEAFTVGVRAGVDPQRLFDVLSVSGGRSHHLLKRFPRALAGDFSPGFKMWLGEKDVGLGLELARSLDVPAPIAGAVRQLFEIALAEGLREDDVVALMNVYRAWSGADPSEPLVAPPSAPR